MTLLQVTKHSTSAGFKLMPKSWLISAAFRTCVRNPQWMIFSSKALTRAARGRLWQMDLWRKRGLGHLSASFGRGFLEQDIAARSVLYRGDMQAQYSSYADDMEEICNAFTPGLNAWIDLCAEEPVRLRLSSA
ncbi:hypothetical protein ACVWZL_009094 [Bradyrhizobium sp. GM2.4]